MVKIRKATIADAEIIIDFQLKMADETENLILNKSIVTKGVKVIFSNKLKGNLLCCRI